MSVPQLLMCRRSYRTIGTTEALPLQLLCMILHRPSHLLVRKIGFGSCSVLATPTSSLHSPATSTTCNQRSERWNLRKLKRMQKKTVRLFAIAPPFFLRPSVSPPFSWNPVVLNPILQALWPWKLQRRQPTMSMTCLLQLVRLFIQI